MKKQYVVLVRDHSASMHAYREAALKDYNTTIAALKSAAAENDIDTIMTVIAARQKGDVKTIITNSSVSAVKALTNYDASGGDTPLLDAVHQAIVELQRVPDLTSPDVSFLVMVTTDGNENSSERSTASGLGRKIAELQATDRWTFTFRTPRGGRNYLSRFSIPGGNVEEWEQSEMGFERATVATASAIGNFYKKRSLGIRGSSTFYADASTVSKSDVKKTMTDISGSVRILQVKNRTQIQSFMEDQLRHPYLPGTAFYELTKPEKVVQAHKGIIVRHKYDGTVYAGQAARDLLGLPNRNIGLKPGDHGDWDIFIQSTSNNRILLPGTRVIHWPGGR